MKSRFTKVGILVLAAAFILSFGCGAYAAMGMGGGGGGGMGGGGTNVANRFSGFGAVTAVDTVAKTVTVDLTMASRLLSDYVGTPFTFQVAANAWIGSMNMGGMMGQTMTPGHGMNGNSTTANCRCPISRWGPGLF